MKNCSPEQRIIVAARRLFFENGFEKTSTDMLAREASVSKATIYKHFENMGEILRHVTEAEVDKFRETMQVTIETRDDLNSALIRYGIQLLTFLNAPDSLRFSCLMHEEARANPAIGRMFFNAAFGQAQKDLSVFLTSAQARGIISVNVDTMVAAEDFIVLLQGFGMIRAQLGVSNKPFLDVEGRVTHAVQIIMAVIGDVS